MSIIGDLIFLLRGDPKQLNVDVKKAGDQAGDTFGKRMAANFKKSWSGQNIGKGLVQGLGMAGGFGAATLLAGGLSKVVDFMGDSIKAASNLNETMTKSRVIFGDGSAEIEKWAETAAKAFGQSKRQALDTASGFAGLFDTVGIGIDKSTDMAQKLTVLGSDLASFFNTDVDTALQALRSGLSGESEPLRKFNVFLSETAVAAKLAQMGIKKTGAAFTEAQKATARYALILEQTGSAQGDFARTSDGMANQGRTLTARMEDLSAALGDKLLPVVIEAQQAALDFMDALEGVGETAASNEQPLDNLANLLHDLFKSPEEEARTFLGTLFDWLTDLQQGLANAGQAAHDWLTFWDSTDEVQHKAANAADHTRDSIEGLKGAAVSDLGGVSNALGGVGDASDDMAGEVVENFKTVKDVWKDLKKTLLADANELISDAFDPMITKDRLRATQAEINAQRIILASKTATAAEKRDARDKLHTLEKDNSEYLLALAEAGQTGSKAYAAGIKELKESIKNAKGPARAALQSVLDKIREVEREGKNVPINIAVNVGAGLGSALKNLFKAEGGPVYAGVPYIVGERGPEIHVPSTNGTILTAAQSMAVASGGGGGVHETNIIQVQGLLPVRTIADIRRERTHLQDSRRLRNGLGRR